MEASMKDILHSLWLQAAGASEPTRVACPTEADATKLRWSLYNAVRGVKSGKPAAMARLPPELVRAAQEVVVSIDPADKRILVLTPVALTPMIQSVLGVLKAPPQAVDAEEAAAAEAHRKLQAALNSVTSPAAGVTPYYSREQGK